MKRLDIFFGLLRIPLDFIMAFLGFLAGRELRLLGDFIPGKVYYANPEVFPAIENFQNLALFFAFLWVLVLLFSNHYRLRAPHGPLKEQGQLIIASVVWALLLMSYFFVIHEVFFSRLVLGFGVIFSLLFTMLARLVLYFLRKSLLQLGIGRRKVLFIGNNAISKHLTKAFKKIPDFEVMGTLSKVDDFVKKITEMKIDEVILTDQKLSSIQEAEILDYCLTHHIEYRFVPDILEVERSNVEIIPVAGFPLIHLKPTSLDGWGKVLKRSMDIVLSLSAAIVLSPMLLLIAIAIKLDSKGPVLFCTLEDGSPALRIGQFGKPFQFFKFRTMRANSHQERYTTLAKDNYRKGPLVKIKNDPRITRLGAFLRRWDLDEWPQLWNVFKGDMSLVGPRPHLPEEVEKYEQRHRFLFTVKPGMSGLAQVSGRSDLDFEEEARLDSSYIREWSLFLDLKIILKTIGVILGRHKEN